MTAKELLAELQLNRHDVAGREVTAVTPSGKSFTVESTDYNPERNEFYLYLADEPVEKGPAGSEERLNPPA